MRDVPSSSVNVAKREERLELESDCVAMSLVATAEILPFWPCLRANIALRLARSALLLRKVDGRSCLNMAVAAASAVGGPLTILSRPANDKSPG